MGLFDKAPKAPVDQKAPVKKDLSGLHPVRTREWYQGKLKQLTEKADKYEKAAKSYTEKAGNLRHRIGNMQKTMEKKIEQKVI